LVLFFATGGQEVKREAGKIRRQEDGEKQKICTTIFQFLVFSARFF
jgi:hypothetical protein